MSSIAETFQTIVNERRSIRAFKSDPVSREVIDAVFAPALRASFTQLRRAPLALMTGG